MQVQLLHVLLRVRRNKAECRQRGLSVCLLLCNLIVTKDVGVLVIISSGT